MRQFVTSPSEATDAVDFDADQHRIGPLHSAIVADHLQDVVVVLLVIQRLRIADNTCIKTRRQLISLQCQDQCSYSIYWCIYLYYMLCNLT